MPIPTTKVAISERVEQLAAQLKAKPFLLANQQDERRALIDSCDRHGGHVPVPYFDGLVMNATSLAYRCEFCRLALSISDEQRSRNILRG